MTRTQAPRGPAETIRLKPLEPFDGDGLDAGGEYEGLEFGVVDLRGQDASDARFTDCRLVRCRLDELVATRARLSECVVEEPEASALDLSDSVLRDVLVDGGRVGALRAPGATWTAVLMRGAKLNFVDLTGSRLRDVAFESCEIGELDLGDAQADSVRLDGCTIDELNIAGARVRALDLSSAILRQLRGVESIRGATLSREQFADLAPLLASYLGVEVRDEQASPPREAAGRRRHLGPGSRSPGGSRLAPDSGRT